VKRLLEQPGDVLEGMSVEPSAMPRYVYTLDHCAGETIRVGERVSFDGESAICWSQGYSYMAQYAYGERIGRTAQLKLGTSAIILGEAGDKILLTRRTDNGRWCLPGGAMDPGESMEECCIREVWEETGLAVRVVRLLGIYSTPHRVTYYEDGQRWQTVTTNFLVEITGGTLGVSNETTAVGFFSPQEMATMDIVDPHLERIQDFFSGQTTVFIR